MHAEKKPKNTHRKKSVARRILKWSLALVLLFLVLFIVGAPLVVSSEGFEKFLLAKINNSVDGRADFADLRMGWLKGVKVDDISYDDDAGRLSVKVKQIATKPHYSRLITGNLSFGETTIDKPQVEITLKDEPAVGETVAPRPVSAPADVPVEAAAIALVTDIVVNDGSVKVTDAQNRTAELSKINSKIGLRLPGEESSLALDAVLVAKGNESKISAGAHLTPSKEETKTGWTLKGATGDLTVEVKDLDLESLEPFLALTGAEVTTKGRLSADLKSEIKDGQVANVVGKVTGAGLDVEVPQLKGDRIRTKALDADIKITRKDKAINVDSLNLTTDWVKLDLTGAVPTDLGGEDFLEPVWNSQLQGSFDCDLAAVASQMPKTLGLKEGTEISSGRLTGRIQTTTEGGRKQIRADADLADLKGTVGGKPVAISQPVQARALLTQTEGQTAVAFDQLNISSAFANIKATGTTEKLQYDADMDLAKLQAELGQFVDLGGYKMAGRLVETGQIAIDPNHIVANGVAQIENLDITSPNNVTVSEPKADLLFALDLDRKQNSLALNTIKADASFGQLNVKDAIVPLGKDANEPMNLIVNAENVDLAKLQPFAVMFASFPKDMQMAGVAVSEIAVTSEKQTYKIATDKTSIKDFELATPGKKPFKQPEIALVADLELDTAAKTYMVRKFNLSSDQIKVNFAPARLSTEKDTTTLVGKADLDCDWAAVGDIASNFLPKGLVLRGRRTTSLDFASQFPAAEPNMLLANLSTSKAMLGFDAAEYRSLQFGPTDLNAQFQQGILSIEPFNTTLSGGQLSFAATADFTQPSPVIRIPQPVSIQGIQIDETLSYEFRGTLATVNPVFKDALGVGGTLNLSAETLVIPLAPERQNDMHIVATLEMDNVNLIPTGLLGKILSPLKFLQRDSLAKVHPTKFTVKDGTLQYDNPMQIDFGSTPIYFKGAVGLDRKLDMQVGIPLGSLTGRTGAGSIAWAALTGTVDEPKIDLSSLLKNQLQDTLIDIFRGALEK